VFKFLAAARERGERWDSVILDPPALYLWNQPAAQSNHTPSWDDYVIPPVP
jgi:23S rRNA G2069 N7-methylase RlmK/C1962 C5-methylase RlmI